MSMYPEQSRTLDYGYAETGETTRVITQFFHQVYLWMAIGLVWTAIVSWMCAYVPALRVMMSPGTLLAASLGAFVVSLIVSRVALKSPLGVSLGLFVLYASLIGFAIGPIWIVYKQGTIGAAFLLTGGIFFIMSLVGFVTKIDLSKLHSIVIMAVIGLFIASIVNFFMASSMLSWFITYAVMILFPILIATETKMLKEFAIENGSNGVAASRMAVVGALMLYVSFINIFIALLRILGDRD
jgi:uncharacterized protein